MTWPELTPITPPLSCFALEFKRANPTCEQCPHNSECQRFMLSRRNRIPLSRAIFHTLPQAYALRFNVDEDDPEIPHLQRVYILCYETIFGHKPQDYNLSLHAEKIIENAHRSDCSIRLYMLANMIGHQRMEAERIAKTAAARVTAFKPWRLTDNRAIERARIYAELCRKEFGAFTLATLSTLAESNAEQSDMESRMLNSEVVAGRWLVGHKIYNQGPPYALLFDQCELELDPHWLAVEDTYKMLVLVPRQGRQGREGTQQERSHRYAVAQVISFLKRHKDSAASIFKARQDILPAAVSKVLEFFGYKPDDFEVEDKPITDPLEMWVALGRAIQHWNLIKYLHGGGSVFDERP